MRRLALGVALASLSLVAACGGGDADPTEAPTSQSADPTEAPTSQPSDAGGTVLTGTVGTDEDPDAFVITLTDDSGQPVSSLPAGEYQIQISDLSNIHNFHLTGEGVDESTTVDEVTDATWEVTLVSGDYSFVCDPHPNMSGAFTVT